MFINIINASSHPMQLLIFVNSFHLHVFLHTLSSLLSLESAEPNLYSADITSLLLLNFVQLCFLLSLALLFCVFVCYVHVLVGEIILFRREEDVPVHSENERNLNLMKLTLKLGRIQTGSETGSETESSSETESESERTRSHSVSERKSENKSETDSESEEKRERESVSVSVRVTVRVTMRLTVSVRVRVRVTLTVRVRVRDLVRVRVVSANEVECECEVEKI